MTNTQGQPNREIVAQGSANLFCALFACMGGCAMIGQSVMNIQSRGRGRLSAIVSAILLFVTIVSLHVGMFPLLPQKHLYQLSTSLLIHSHHIFFRDIMEYFFLIITVVAKIPVGTLVGVMFVVVIHTFDWASLYLILSAIRYWTFISITNSLVISTLYFVCHERAYSISSYSNSRHRFY